MARSLIHRFLEAVLGEEAATALKKAADQSDAIDSVLGPRAIMGWLKLQSRWGYNGEVPGQPGSYLVFSKNERGFSGQIRWGEHSYRFEQQNITHVASAIACALKVDKPVAKSLRDHDLLALGENVDLLVKTRFLAKAEESSSEESHECSKCGGDQVNTYDGDVQDDVWKCPKCDTRKFEAPGGHASQNAPSAPTAPEAQTGKAPSRNKKKGFSTKLSASQAVTKCSVCDAPQFSGDVFVGCHCLRDLARFAKAEAVVGGFEVTFGPEWSKQDVAVLLDIVGGDE